MAKIKNGDTVQVLAGRDKGKIGKVLKVFPKTGRGVVENIQFVKKHTRPNPQKNIKGGIVEKEGSLSLSNLMVVCKECGKPARLGYRILDDQRKVRFCKKCQGVQD